MKGRLRLKLLLDNYTLSNRIRLLPLIVTEIVSFSHTWTHHHALTHSLTHHPTHQPHQVGAPKCYLFPWTVLTNLDFTTSSFSGVSLGPQKEANHGPMDGVVMTWQARNSYVPKSVGRKRDLYDEEEGGAGHRPTDPPAKERTWNGTCMDVEREGGNDGFVTNNIGWSTYAAQMWWTDASFNWELSNNVRLSYREHRTNVVRHLGVIQ